MRPPKVLGQDDWRKLSLANDLHLGATGPGIYQVVRHKLAEHERITDARQYEYCADRDHRPTSGTRLACSIGKQEDRRAKPSQDPPRTHDAHVRHKLGQRRKGSTDVGASPPPCLNPRQSSESRPAKPPKDLGPGEAEAAADTRSEWGRQLLEPLESGQLRGKVVEALWLVGYLKAPAKPKDDAQANKRFIEWPLLLGNPPKEFEEAVEKGLRRRR